jgi:hypothetical protein
MLELPKSFRTVFIEKLNIISHNVYFTDLNLYDSGGFRNHHMCKLVDLIGEQYKKVIKGRGSHRHNGIKKIILSCKNKYDVVLSAREVKCMLSSQKRWIGIINAQSCKCPYSIDKILKIIIEITLAEEVIKDKFKRYLLNKHGKIVQEACHLLLLHKHFAGVLDKLNLIDNLKDEKGKERTFRSYNRLRELYDRLITNFDQNKCEIIN